MQFRIVSYAQIVTETADLWGMSTLNTNVYAKFRCVPLLIKKAFEIFGR